MFKNPGQKLKRVSSVFFWISVVATVGFFILFGLGLISPKLVGQTPKPFYLSIHWDLFFISIGIIIGSWISSLCLYAFGTFVEDSEKQRVLLEQLISLEYSQAGYYNQQATYQQPQNDGLV